MRKLLILCILALGLFLPMQPKEAECYGCLSDTCYSSIECGQACYCQIRGMETRGTCVTKPNYR